MTVLAVRAVMGAKGDNICRSRIISIYKYNHSDDEMTFPNNPMKQLSLFRFTDEEWRLREVRLLT